MMEVHHQVMDDLQLVLLKQDILVQVGAVQLQVYALKYVEMEK